MSKGIKLDLSNIDFLPSVMDEIESIKKADDPLGKASTPLVEYKEDEPYVIRQPHKFIDDVTFIYISGYRYIEGEGRYEEGDVRFVPAGTVCGEDKVGEKGCAYWVISASPAPVGVFENHMNSPSFSEVDKDIDTYLEKKCVRTILSSL